MRNRRRNWRRGLRKENAVLLIDTYIPIVAKTFMVDLIDLILENGLPIVWALRYADYWDQRICTTDVIRASVLQTMQVSADRLLESSFLVTVEQLREAASLGECVFILMYLLSSISHAFIALDADLLAHEPAHERSLALEMLDMLRSKLPGNIKILIAISSVSRAYAEELEHSNAYFHKRAFFPMTSSHYALRCRTGSYQCFQSPFVPWRERSCTSLTNEMIVCSSIYRGKSMPYTFDYTDVHHSARSISSGSGYWKYIELHSSRTKQIGPIICLLVGVCAALHFNMVWILVSKCGVLRFPMYWVFILQTGVYWIQVIPFDINRDVVLQSGMFPFTNKRTLVLQKEVILAHLFQLSDMPSLRVLVVQNQVLSADILSTLPVANLLGHFRLSDLDQARIKPNLTFFFTSFYSQEDPGLVSPNRVEYRQRYQSPHLPDLVIKYGEKGQRKHAVYRLALASSSKWLYRAFEHYWKLKPTMLTSKKTTARENWSRRNYAT
ncbi:uncharacterized protein BDR25DRAFT_355736 [Lindgomyces ingoldianus]|uniref:Uncharacterized protein n=1 Tax=Lindgomyces ingoldianus TaxID=673940 RepID=A0ACB6QSN9_9PLEO|nr:uncharacterized protein BDR25DRAFT_355736 [Lindgomyces ingoldianus]KAF2470008.1 hypothetical protein BDR25DRAFT_355736 [Lindgomyces ingoldianus]